MQAGTSTSIPTGGRSTIERAGNDSASRPGYIERPGETSRDFSSSNVAAAKRSNTRSSFARVGTVHTAVDTDACSVNLIELLGPIRDAIAFIGRHQRLSRRCIDEAAMAALKVILHQQTTPGEVTGD